MEAAVGVAKRSASVARSLPAWNQRWREEAEAAVEVAESAVAAAASWAATCERAASAAAVMARKAADEAEAVKA